MKRIQHQHSTSRPYSHWGYVSTRSWGTWGPFTSGTSSRSFHHGSSSVRATLAFWGPVMILTFSAA